MEAAQLVPFLLSILLDARSLSALHKVILEKLFVAVHPFLELPFPCIIYQMFSVICACSEACALRTFLLAKLDYCNRHRALKCRCKYGACLRVSRDCH
jgi:hypothetical protein